MQPAAGAQDRGSIAAAPLPLPGPHALEQIAHHLDAGSQVVHWDGRASEPADAAAELLGATLGAHPHDPLFAFSAYLMHLRAHSQRLVVVIDDLDALPPRTAQWLRAALDSSGGTLRALACAADDAAAERAVARLGLALLRPSAPMPAPAASGGWIRLASGALLLALVGALFLGLR